MKKIKNGDMSPLLDHFNKVFKPEEVERVVNFLAYIVQRQGEKINLGLILQGLIGGVKKNDGLGGQDCCVHKVENKLKRS